MKYIARTVVLALAIAMSAGGMASAHVVVRPSEVETAAFQTFTTSVPNEKDAADTVRLRLVIPAGLKHVTPTVKPGWTIETVKSGDGESAEIKEIIWNGGTVPPGQRDEFSFSAQVPAEPVTLQWDAYQSYSDGETVAWDQKPAAADDHSGKPFSETKVVEQLSTAVDDASSSARDGSNQTRTSVAIGLAVVAIVVSVVALTRKKG